jgi:hypothetical protein
MRRSRGRRGIAVLGHADRSRTPRALGPVFAGHTPKIDRSAAMERRPRPGRRPSPNTRPRVAARAGLEAETVTSTVSPPTGAPGGAGGRGLGRARSRARRAELPLRRIYLSPARVNAPESRSPVKQLPADRAGGVMRTQSARREHRCGISRHRPQRDQCAGEMRVRETGPAPTAGSGDEHQRGRGGLRDRQPTVATGRAPRGARRGDRAVRTLPSIARSPGRARSRGI